MLDKIKSALKNQNFTIAIILVIGGFWVGFSEEQASSLVISLYGVVAAVATTINFFKDAKLDPLKWVKNGNFWAYLAVIVTTLAPSVPIELVDMIKSIVIDILGGNYQGLIGSIFALATFLYKVFTTKPPADPEPVAA